MVVWQVLYPELDANTETEDMNVFELVIFLSSLFLSFGFGVYFFDRIGWWSVLPAVILGFGLVYGVLNFITKMFGHSDNGSGPE